MDSRSEQAETARIDHLRLIQAVVDRMARNSFATKTGSFTSVGGLAILAVSRGAPFVAAASLALVIMFWGLDAYFLRQERLFRRLYDAVRTSDPPLPGSEGYFSMDISQSTLTVHSWRRTWLSVTLISFYGFLSFFVGLMAWVITQSAS